MNFFPAGFVANVMEALTAEATAPPLPFPWKRAWPLGAAFAGLFVWLVIQQFEPSSTAQVPDLYTWLEMIAPMASEWVIGALLMTVAITAWSLRLVRLR